jgi:hypothetical protein
MTTFREPKSPTLRRALAQPTRSRPVQRARRLRPLRALIINRAPAPNSDPTAHGPSPTAPPSPLPKDLQNNLFEAYLTTNDTAPAIAAQFNISLQDFITWHDHPSTQRILHELDRIATERAEHQRKQSAPSATQALIEILDSRHLIKNPEPARKSANKLLTKRSIERPKGPNEPSRAGGRKPTVTAAQTRKPQRGDTPSTPIIPPTNHRAPEAEHRGTDPRRIIERPEGPNERSRAGGPKPTEKAACIEEPQRGDTPSTALTPPTNQRAPNPEHRVAPVIPSPMPHPRKIFRLAALALSMLVPLATTGCKPSKPPEAATTIVKHTYTVRGEVQQLPDPTDARKEFLVRHEEIPEFKGPQGQLGMKAMVMPFPLGEGFKADGLSVGQKITLKFTVEFDTATDRPKRYYADSWTPLDASTTLDFSDRAKGT